MILFILISNNILPAQGFLRTQGTAIVNEMGDPIILRGMGLGGWMLQEGYMLQTADFANAQYQIREKIEQLIGEQDTEQFYQAWLSNHVTEEDIDSLKAWGFNSVRLPMHYKLFTLPIEEEPVRGKHTWLDRGFKLTDSLISWCKQNKMYVILDLHAAPGGQGYDQGISDYDPSKPSLWESEENRAKTVALWKKLAERYADEPWVAGYDLINEPNWDLPENRALKELYMTLTDSIRMVDTNHILFIEGNWFANDFTGLTPPWDDNMVYSPHKYGSINDQASIQWVLDIRKNHNTPLYFGESGENSNAWFRDAIKLFEDNDIGWAWWPMKKIDAIAGPLSISKTEEYQTLLDYWNGSGAKPTKEFAVNTLMDLTDKLKINNCLFQKDVIDAMFRQVHSDETKPFRIQQIPGTVYATDFDMGVVGKAYHDSDLATYHVSTGQYTAWNKGWSYRNDGVDIEPCEDIIHSNGYNVGWTEQGEWMQYDIHVLEDGVYDVEVRLAAQNTEGRFHFMVGEADVSELHEVQGTGGWDVWDTQIIPNVILNTADQKLKFYIDKGGFNVSSFEFVKKSSTEARSALFMSAMTLDEHTIQMNTNKYLEGPLSDYTDFSIDVDGEEIPISEVNINPSNPRILYFTIEPTLRFDQIIKISYQGNQVKASDGTLLKKFSRQIVKNTLTYFHPIPGRIEAEDFFHQSGVQLETTSDDGGGQNIGYLDIGDYLEYKVEIKQEGSYDLHYRVASLNASGGLRVMLIDEQGTEKTIDTPRFSATGGWQNWQTFTSQIELIPGFYTLRIVVARAPFNINWIEFASTAPPPETIPLGVSIFPNPSYGPLNVQAHFSTTRRVDINIYDMLGREVFSRKYGFTELIEDNLALDQLASGYYFLILKLEDGTSYKYKVNKIGN